MLKEFRSGGVAPTQVAQDNCCAASILALEGDGARSRRAAEPGNCTRIEPFLTQLTLTSRPNLTASIGKALGRGRQLALPYAAGNPPSQL